MTRLKIDRRLSVPLDGLIIYPRDPEGILLCVAGQQLPIKGEIADAVLLWQDGRLTAPETIVNGVTVIDIAAAYESLGALGEFRRETGEESTEESVPMPPAPPAILELPSVQQRLKAPVKLVNPQRPTGPPGTPVLQLDRLERAEAGEDIWGEGEGR